MTSPLKWLVVVGLSGASACSNQDPTESAGDLSPSLHRGSDARIPGLYGLGEGREGCHATGFRQFDFWIGTWAITDPNGDPSGVSQVSKVLRGCAVTEFFAGGTGQSLNRFEPATGLWHQDYVDNTGFTLRLFGRFVGGVMALDDSVRAIPGGPALASQFRWTPNPDGTVRQRWNFSFDGGASFINDWFNGLYVPNPAYVSPPPPLVLNCAAPAYRAADGLLGNWNVATSEGRRLGRASLVLAAGSCLIEETFRGRDGFALRSYLYFDRFIRTWYRAQADNRGEGLRLGGGFAGGPLQLAGVVPAENGRRATSVRLTWSLEGPDRAIQLWERQGRDGGWLTVIRLVWTRTA